VLCAIPWAVDDTKCWAQLDSYDLVSIANYDIARANTSALRNTEAAFDQIVQAGKLQQQLSQIRQELLEQERRAHTLDNWYHRGLIALGVLAIAL
jgi:hypothetical protein